MSEGVMTRHYAGIGNAASYMVSSIPFLTSSVSVSTGSATEITFPTITKFVTIRNDGDNPLKFGFSENGVINGTNFAVLSASESFSADYRVGSIFFETTTSTTTCTVIAGLTRIKKEAGFNNWSGSSGVG